MGAQAQLRACAAATGAVFCRIGGGVVRDRRVFCKPGSMDGSAVHLPGSVCSGRRVFRLRPACGRLREDRSCAASARRRAVFRQGLRSYRVRARVGAGGICRSASVSGQAGGGARTVGSGAVCSFVPTKGICATVARVACQMGRLARSLTSEREESKINDSVW